MTDLAALFATDPLELSKQDLETIVVELRKKRNQFNLGGVSAGSMKPQTERQKTVAGIASKLGLDDL